jgi:hypothetical protein
MRRAEREDGEQHQQQRVADEGDGQCHGAGTSSPSEPSKIAPCTFCDPEEIGGRRKSFPD